MFFFRLLFPKVDANIDNIAAKYAKTIPIMTSRNYQ